MASKEATITPHKFTVLPEKNSYELMPHLEFDTLLRVVLHRLCEPLFTLSKNFFNRFDSVKIRKRPRVQTSSFALDFNENFVSISSCPPSRVQSYWF